MTSKQWQEIKNNPELYEERKRKRKLWFHKPEVAERRKAKLKEQYRKRKEENPEEHRKFRDIENKRRLKNNRYGGLTYKEWRLQNPELYKLKLEKAKQRRKERRILGIIERLCIKWADGDENAALLLNQIFGEENGCP